MSLCAGYVSLIYQLLPLPCSKSTASRSSLKCARLFAAVLVCEVLWCGAALPQSALPTGLDADPGPHRNAEGWTVFTPAPGSGTCGAAGANHSGTCIYYVSNKGADNPVNCKGYPPPIMDAPPTTCASLAYAVSQTRPRKPDWVLLRKGDTFYPTENARLWAHGRSAQEPMLISAYPMVKNSGPKPVIDFKNSSTNATVAVFATHLDLKYLAITGLTVVNSGRDPASRNFNLRSLGQINGRGGLASLKASFGWVLVEDCEVGFGGAGIAFQFPSKEIIFRRNAVVAPYPSTNSGDITGEKGPGGIGLFGTDWESMLIEENLFYMAGWNKDLITGGTVTISNGSPAIITWGDGLPPKGRPPDGSLVAIRSTGTLPSGIVNNTFGCRRQQCYFVRDGNGNATTLSLSKTDDTRISTTGHQNGLHTAYWIDPQPNMYEHNLYLDLGTWQLKAGGTVSGKAIFRDNITAYSSATGIQNRSGGAYFNNLFLRNPIGLNCCQWPSDISYNVLLEPNDMQTVPPQPYGWGMTITNFTCAAPGRSGCDPSNPPTPGSGGTTITRNILAHALSDGSNGKGIHLYPEGSYGFGYPATTGITVTHNIICDWPTYNKKPIFDQGSHNTITNNVTRIGDCNGLGFSNPNRTVGGYYTSIGGPVGATTDDFLNAAMAKWNRENWDPRYLASAVNSYIRAGFDMADPR